MKVAIYCRVSTEEQDADKQESACLEYCKRNKLEVFKVYKDIISGTANSRPEFNKLLEEGDKHTIEEVGRRLREMMPWMKK